MALWAPPPSPPMPACVPVWANSPVIFRCGYTIMQIAAPEAMSKDRSRKQTILKQYRAPDKYDAIGIGPGIGAYDSHAQLLETIFDSFKKPLVIDADALNMLAKHPALIEKIPPFSILTPHPTEFDRLVWQIGQ